jgi:hypothetical protein
MWDRPGPPGEKQRLLRNMTPAAMRERKPAHHACMQVSCTSVLFILDCCNQTVPLIQTNQHLPRLAGECSWNVCSEGRYLCWESVSRRGTSLEMDFACCPDKNTAPAIDKQQTLTLSVTPSMSIELTKQYRTRVLVVETVAPGKYLKLFNATSPTNKQWAKVQGYCYFYCYWFHVCSWSVPRRNHGQKEWQATFNKVFLLQYVYTSMLSDYDLLFYLNADVLVRNPYFCVEHFLSSNHLLGAHAGTGKHGTRWNKIAGVVLYNLKHPMMENFSKTWSDQSKGEINSGNECQ